MKYTVDQQKVLDDDSQSLIVSASAGSGKTATIIQKIFGLISKDNIDISKLLVITFTESASSEMKLRLKQILRENAIDNKFLQSQLDKLPLANISTLHSFCSKMIRKYFFYLDLKPNFVVLSDYDSNFLKAKALEKTIKFYSKKMDEDFIKLSNIFGGGRNFESLKKNILSFGEFLDSVEDRTKFLSNIAMSCYESDLDKNVACQYLNKYVISNFLFLLDRTESKIVDAKKCKAEYYLQILSDLRVQLLGVNKKNDFTSNHNSIKNFALPRLTRKKLSDEDADFKEDFSPFWEMVKKRIGDIKSFVVAEKNQDELEKDLVDAKSFLTKFIEVEQLYEKFYKEAKVSRNGLDFNDLERYFLDLLNFDEVKQATQFEYIFVDEYQDINSVQEKILSKLSTKSKMIMVGDVKQSIYAFRNSTPDIFVQKSKLYKQDKLQGRLISLNENFRSNAVVLEFVNQIFDRCMSEDFGGVDYKQNSQLKGKAEYKNCSNIPIVEVNIVDSLQEDNEEFEQEYDKVYSVLNDKNEYSQELTKARKEAMIVASKILEIIGKDYYDCKQGLTKKITFSDITILCRKNEFLKDIAKVLLEYKVPIETNLLDNIYNNKDVVLLLDLLKIINNFHDDESLSVVMSSNFFNFSFDEMAQIRAEFEAEEFFYNCVKKYAIEGKSSEIKQKILQMFSYLQKAKEQLVYLSLYEFLLDVCQNFNYFDFLLSLPDGINRQKIVKDFIDSISMADYNYDLVGFLDYVKDFAKDSSFKSSLVANVSSVKLGTIHSSKGLEYPIVFLVGCGNPFSKKTFTEEILKDKDFGLGVNTFDLEDFNKNQNLARNCITLHKAKLEKAEELRLLYVALTRAKNHLFVVGSANLSKMRHIDNCEDAKGVNSYLPWIMSMLSPANYVNITNNKKSLTQKMPNGEVTFNVYKGEDFVFDKGEDRGLNFNMTKKQLCEKLEKNIKFIFDKKPKIALKNSVSSLLLENDELNQINSEPKKLSVYEIKRQDINQAKLGTLYHNIMQQIDFKKDFSKQDFENIVDNLSCFNSYKKYISYQKINNCVQSIKNFGNITTFKSELPFLGYIPYSLIFNDNRDDKVLVQGIADLVVLCDGKYYLIDYKTTKATNSDQLVEKYKLQLKLYRICIEKALNIKFEATYIYSFYLEKLIKIF